MKTAICPGSFDPVTLGHMDIIRRASKIFDKVIVAVMVNPAKKTAFTLEERVALLKKAIVGVEIEITDMGGKWKMSQEMGEGDREGVVEGFEGMGTELGRCMAQTVRERAELAGKR